MIVRRTPKLPVSSRRLSSLNTVSISIGFGATRSPPPNDVRWLQRQRRRWFVDWGPTCNDGDDCKKLSIVSAAHQSCVIMVLHPQISSMSFGDVIIAVDGYRFTGLCQGMLITGMNVKFVAFVLIFTVFWTLNSFYCSVRQSLCKNTSKRDPKALKEETYSKLCLLKSKFLTISHTSTLHPSVSHFCWSCDQNRQLSSSFAIV